MCEKIRKNIHIEILKYAQQHTEFTAEELIDGLSFNLNERQLFYDSLINDKSLLHNTGRVKETAIGTESIFTISTEGRFKLIQFEELDNSLKSSLDAKKLGTWSIWVAIITLVSTSIFNTFSLYKTQQSLELSKLSLDKTQQSLEISAFPEITLNVKDERTNRDEINFPGHYEIKESTVDFILKNNFLGKIKDIDIEMFILKIYKDQKSKYLAVCPFGYIDFTKNPNFFVDDFVTTSILDNNLYRLNPLEEMNFTLDYKNMKEVLNNKAPKSDFFIKVDIKFKKEIDNKQYSFSKIYMILKLFTISGKDIDQEIEYFVDTDIDKEMVGVASKDNEILLNTNFLLPFIIYPFKNQNFVESVKSKFVPPYSLLQSECLYFELNPKIKTIE